MAEKPPLPEPSYLSLALAALVAELDDLSPGLSERARRRLKNEADLSLVWGLHGEHESDARRIEHAKAVEWLGRLHGIVEISKVAKAKKRGKKRA